MQMSCICISILLPCGPSRLHGSQRRRDAHRDLPGSQPRDQGTRLSVRQPSGRHLLTNGFPGANRRRAYSRPCPPPGPVGLPASRVTTACSVAFPAGAGRAGPNRLSCDAADQHFSTGTRRCSSSFEARAAGRDPAPSAEDLFSSRLPGPRPRPRSGDSSRSADRRAGLRSPIALSAGSVQARPPFHGR